MNTVIIVAGVAGLAIAAYAFIDLTVSSVRRRRVLDIAIVVAAAAATIASLLVWGDRLLQ
ncbi:MAG TPA: hypothetical protein VJ787_14470 [Thermoleophilia bacterium]|nr:hypothetical protein [Thermoleophilia bacterium]